jgi:hypothetical protein
MDAAPLLSLSSGQHHFVVNLIEMGGVEFVAIELKGRLASSTLRQFGERVLIVPGHQDGASTEGAIDPEIERGDWSTSNDFVETTTSHDIDRFPCLFVNRRFKLLNSHLFAPLKNGRSTPLRRPSANGDATLLRCCPWGSVDLVKVLFQPGMLGCKGVSSARESSQDRSANRRKVRLPASGGCRFHVTSSADVRVSQATEVEIVGVNQPGIARG